MHSRIGYVQLPGINAGGSLQAMQETDRNKVVYKTSLTPDVPIPGGDNFTDLRQDAKVAAALKWLKKQKSR